MYSLASYPYLVGVASNGRTVQLKNNIDAVSAFIAQAGSVFDLTVTSPVGDKVLKTKGSCIKWCSNKELGVALEKRLS